MWRTDVLLSATYLNGKVRVNGPLAIKLNKFIVKAQNSNFLSLIMPMLELKSNKAHYFHKCSSNSKKFELHLTLT
jgi:hypothetical protein